jgi:serine phosphatase RsbU (regulator of sigma subunit)
MEAQIAVAKIRKYATSNSGDTVEVVERPHGGLSVVLADGQSSGRGAKSVSTLVVRKVISLLAEGVRDGAAARAASDSLFTERKVSATLNIVSVDQRTQTMVITRNNPSPAFVAYDNEIQILDEPCKPVGLYRDTRPQITEIPLETGVMVVVFSDGLEHAGERCGCPMNINACLKVLLDGESPSPSFIADTLLEQAINLDEKRPADDISIVVVGVIQKEVYEIRRMIVHLPLDS